MFKMEYVKRVVLVMVLGAMLSALAGCEPSQFAADQGLTDAGKVAQRAWFWWYPPPRR